MNQVAYNYKIEKIIASVMIITGGLIYVLYRPPSLLLFRVADYVGLTPYVEQIQDNVSYIYMPSFVINSLPAGLWTASYLIFMYINTRFHNRGAKLLLSLPLPASAIVLEFLQLTEWFPGTFDLWDLVCYIIPMIIFIKSI